MPDICETVSATSKGRIKEMIRDATKTKQNQNALADDGKIISVISGGRSGHRIAGEGKGIIYSPAPVLPRRTTLALRKVLGVPQHTDPTPADLVEMVQYDRPFSCRAQRLFGVERLACFTPDDPTYPIADKFIDATAATETDFNNSMQFWVKWGESPKQPHNLFERAMYREIMWRRARGRDLLKVLAPEALEQCEVRL